MEASFAKSKLPKLKILLSKLLSKKLFWPIPANFDGCPKILFLLIKLPFDKKLYTKNVDISTAGKKVMIF